MKPEFLAAKHRRTSCAVYGSHRGTVWSCMTSLPLMFEVNAKRKRASSPLPSLFPYLPWTHIEIASGPNAQYTNISHLNCSVSIHIYICRRTKPRPSSSQIVSDWLECGLCDLVHCLHIFLTFTTSVFSRDRARGDANVRQNEIALKPYEITIFYAADQYPPRAKGELAQCTEVFYWLELQVVVLLRQKLVQCHISVDGVNLDSFRRLAKKMVRWKMVQKMVKWQGGNADTDLEADPVFWICLLTFRWSEHWRQTQGQEKGVRQKRKLKRRHYVKRNSADKRVWQTQERYTVGSCLSAANIRKTETKVTDCKMVPVQTDYFSWG